jgi:hypothetical protein
MCFAYATYIILLLFLLLSVYKKEGNSTTLSLYRWLAFHVFSKIVAFFIIDLGSTKSFQLLAHLHNENVDDCLMQR